MNRTIERLVETLEEMIGNTIEEQLNNNDLEVDADKINGLDEYIDDKLKDMTVDADNVNGLERFVENILNDITVEVDADNVKGLGRAVEEAMTNVLDEDLDRRVFQALNNGDGYRVNPTAVAESFKHPEVKTALDAALKESLLRVLTTLLLGAVPIAAPVVTPAPATPAPEEKPVEAPLTELTGL